MAFSETPFPCPGNLQRSSGFTLVELCIVIVIAGIIVAAAASTALPIFHTASQVQTDAKLSNIAKAIDYYATQNNRVPCPAVADTATANPPFGYEAGSGANGDVVPATCGAVPSGWQGIVPFKTLNIPADWARDAWGHYITYAISPNFSQDVINNPAFPVHARCRTSDWFSAGIVYESGTYEDGAFQTILDPTTGLPATNVFLPRNERKARFCCSGALDTPTDLVIEDVNSVSQIAVPRQSTLPGAVDVNPNPGGGTGYNRSNITFPTPMASNVQVPDNDRVSAPVYVLISAGPNGYGAYTGIAGGRLPTTGATADEIINASNYTAVGKPRVFYEIPPIDRTNNNAANPEMNFDDVVLWRTQDMMFATQGKSCSLP